MKKILITGSDGFLGSHLCELLVKKNYEIKALTYYNSFNSKGWLDTIPKEINQNINFVAGDIRDKELVKSAMSGCDCVIHLAALIAIPYSYVSPKSYIETNIVGTYNVLQSARELATEKIIHTSSSEVYGTAQKVPIDENHPLEGQSPYAATKIAADQLALSFYRSFDIPLAILRPFNIYGPRQSSRAVIPTIISQINNNIKNIELGNLDPTRDFTYVTETARAFELSIKAKKNIGEVINIGSNFDISIRDTFQLIAEKMNKDVKIKVAKGRLRPDKSEVKRLLASNKKAKRILNWQPKLPGVKGFKEGIEHTIEWFSDEKNLAYYNSINYVK